jgi:hypothetical protein
VLGIDADGLNLIDAPSYTSKLSGIVKCGQIMLLATAKYMVADGLYDNLLEAVYTQMHEFFTFRAATPMDKIFDLRAFSEVLRNCMTVDGDIM